MVAKWLKIALQIAGGAVSVYAIYHLASKNLSLFKTSSKLRRKNPLFQIQEAMTARHGGLKRKTTAGFRDVHVDIGWEEGVKTASIFFYEDAAMTKVTRKISLARLIFFLLFWILVSDNGF